MASGIHATEVDLGGLLTVLGSHLYSTPAVAVRELVQNAHDSISRRRIEDPAFDGGAIDPARRASASERPSSGCSPTDCG